MRYEIKRICWCDLTFNGYTDSPYWLITFNNYTIGLKDNGEIWSIINGVVINEFIISKVLTILNECKLNIKISN